MTPLLAQKLLEIEECFIRHVTQQNQEAETIQN